MEKKQVVLLPALLCNGDIFINQVHHLQNEAEFFIPSLGTDGTVRDLAARILTQAPKTFALGGISMGGYVAFEILRQAPERVSSLLLMDTTATADAPEKKESRLQMMQKARTNGIEAVVPDVLLSVVAPQYRTLPQLRRFMTFMAQSVGVDAFCNEEKIIMSRPDSTEILSKISCPVFVAGGTADAITPP